MCRHYSAVPSIGICTYGTWYNNNNKMVQLVIEPSPSYQIHYDYYIISTWGGYSSKGAWSESIIDWRRSMERRIVQFDDLTALKM